MFGVIVLVFILIGFNLLVVIFCVGVGILIFYFCIEGKVFVFLGLSFVFILVILVVKEVYGGDLVYV